MMSSVRGSEESGCEDEKTTLTKTTAETSKIWWPMRLLAEKKTSVTCLVSVKKMGWQIWQCICKVLWQRRLYKIGTTLCFYIEWYGNEDDCGKDRKETGKIGSTLKGPKRLGTSLSLRKRICDTAKTGVSDRRIYYILSKCLYLVSGHVY